jgi:RNA polymerase sigma-70 factor (ECF subfamily)
MSAAANSLTVFGPPPSDEELAARAQVGCAASIEELLRRFQVPLLHFLRHVGPAADAEDVLQETFLRAYTRLQYYRPKWRFATWLFTIARRTSINYHRRTRPSADDAALQRAASPAPGPADAAADADSRQYLWRAARWALAEDELAALWLYYVDEMPVAEIAAILDRTRAAVKTMMFRARKKLLPLVGELAPGEVWPAMNTGGGLQCTHTIEMKNTNG